MMAPQALDLPGQLFLSLNCTENLLDGRILPSSCQDLVKAIYHPLNNLERYLPGLSDANSKERLSQLLSKYNPYIDELRDRTANNSLNHHFEDLAEDARWLAKKFQTIANEASQKFQAYPMPKSPINSPPYASQLPATPRKTGTKHHGVESLQIKELREELSQRDCEIAGLVVQNDQLQSDLLKSSREIALRKTVTHHHTAEAVKCTRENERMLVHVRSLHTAVRNINTLIPMPDLQDKWDTLEGDLPGLVRNVNNLNIRLQVLAFNRRSDRPEVPTIEGPDSSTKSRAIMPPAPFISKRPGPIEQTPEMDSSTRKISDRTLHYRPWTTSPNAPRTPIRDAEPEEHVSSERVFRGRARRRERSGLGA